MNRCFRVVKAMLVSGAQRNDILVEVSHVRCAA